MNEEKLKVLFVSKAYPSEVDIQNGIFVKKHALAASLHADVKVIFITTSNENKTIRSQVSESFEEIIIYTKKSNKISNYIQRKKAYQDILKELENSWGIPNIIHGNIFLRGAFDAYKLSKKYSIPFIVSTHWSGFVNGDYEKMPFFRKFMFKKVAKKAARITSVSNFLANKVQKLLNVNPIVIENIIEVAQKPETLAKQDSTITALMVADLRDEIKNISGVLYAMKQVAESHPNFKLNIIGDGPDKTKLINLSKQLGIYNKSAFFLGRKSNQEVLTEIQKSSFSIINSNIETFSVFTLESIFSGKPVICTKCGGPEDFVNLNNGLLINKKNKEELKNAITYLIQNLHDYSAEKVKTSIQLDLTELTIGKRLFSLYNEVIRKTI